MLVRKLVVVGLLLTVAAPTSAEQILFSNLGPGDSYHSGLAGVFGFVTSQEGDPDRNFSQVMSFSPAVPATLSTIELPLEFPWSYTDGPMELNLFESDAAGLPGRLLESFVTSDRLLPNQLTTFSSALQPMLFAGTTYFLEARTTSEADGLWYHVLADAVPAYRGVYRYDDGPWENLVRISELAYRVTGEPAAAATPEPGSLLLFATGAALVARRRIRRAG